MIAARLHALEQPDDRVRQGSYGINLKSVFLGMKDESPLIEARRPVAFIHGLGCCPEALCACPYAARDGVSGSTACSCVSQLTGTQRDTSVGLATKNRALRSSEGYGAHITGPLTI